VADAIEKPGFSSHLSVISRFAGWRGGREVGFATSPNNLAKALQRRWERGLQLGQRCPVLGREMPLAKDIQNDAEERLIDLPGLLLSRGGEGAGGKREGTLEDLSGRGKVEWLDVSGRGTGGGAGERCGKGGLKEELRGSKCFGGWVGWKLRQ
jgi:hypothetical protein